MMFNHQPAQEPEDDDATLVLLPEQKQQLYRRHSALLSGLIVPQQSASISPQLAEVIDHREQMHARQTRELAALVQKELAHEARLHEQRQSPLSPPAPEPIRVQPPAHPTLAAPAPATPPSVVLDKPARWRRMLEHLRPRRIPVLLQLSVVECGTACLAMLLCYYGRKTSVAEVRHRCQVGRDGLSALDLVKAARSYGLRVRHLPARR